MIQVGRPCWWKLRPTGVVPSSEASGDRKNQEDGACILNREVEYDEQDREEGQKDGENSVVHTGAVLQTHACVRG